jgi:hypothetical protein
MKLTVMEIRRRIAIHQEWKVAAFIGVEMFRSGFIADRVGNMEPC